MLTSFPYDLSPAQTKAVIAEFLSTVRRRGRFLTVVAGSDHPLAAVARTVECQVFNDAFGNTPEVMAAEYGPYESSSIFYLVIDTRTAQPAGAARVIIGDRLKTLDDAPAHIGRTADEILDAHNLRGEPVWDFATAAVLPAYRGRLTVSSMLYRTFAVACLRAGVNHAVTLLDKRAYRNMTLVGARQEPLAGSAPFAYLGSPETYALYSRPFSYLPDIRRQSRNLLRPGHRYTGHIRARGLKALLVRLAAARVSHQVGTGRGLDRNIVFTV
ncbi:hypothetical protein OWR29_45980 [Actinoplanes sp. Pm04-4]|uniref:GNAT family N-acetyltransferase n=1 Tax=Paractinoplanes pyxinae TaxID=2997416 RepID=A0ABT4BFV3_9ACTN|nr:hypothetical protein [Actinoplanes pyxinae]MCY1145398.1 hypothetical protein [Actinoplanes pyxinae]